MNVDTIGRAASQYFTCIIYLFITYFCTWQWTCMTHKTDFFLSACVALLSGPEWKTNYQRYTSFSQNSIRETAWADSTRERGLTHYHQITPKEMSCGHMQPQSLITEEEDEYVMPTLIFSPGLVTCSGPDLHVGGRGAIDYGSRLCFNICMWESTQYVLLHISEFVRDLWIFFRSRISLMEIERQSGTTGRFGSTQ